MDNESNKINLRDYLEAAWNGCMVIAVVFGIFVCPVATIIIVAGAVIKWVIL